MKKITSLLCVALLGAVAAHAVPAKKIWRTFTQPDGSTVELMQGGDEYSHYFITRDGDYILQDAEGVFKYATVDAQGTLTTLEVAAGKQLPAELKLNRAAIEQAIELRGEKHRQLRGAKAWNAAQKKAIPQSGMGLDPSNNYPRTGDVRCLVFLVEYSDVKFRVADPQKYYDEFCNSENFTANGATGSVGQYFRDQSDNKFRPVYDVYGPVPLKYTRSYYGANNSVGDDKNAEQMVVEAVEYYKNQIDYSKYDFDGDGNVDNIFILYAGQGEASYGPAESVWPHSFELHYTMTCPVYNGKKIDSYTCTNEWEDRNPEGIGTFCHEFSHTMGLPDLYHTSNSYANYTPGTWSVLDYGPYNNDGRTPPNYSIFERNAMGWIEPTVLDGPACITLEDITTNTGCIIQTENTNEFFLIENRQKKGWDTYIPGHGMLIWHIDYNTAKFQSNTVNNSSSHQYVDIVEANNNPNSNSETNMAAYAFPGTQNKTEFSSTTTPALKSWNGKAIDMPLTNITEQNGLILFDVAGGFYELDAPSGLKAKVDDEGHLTLSWNPVNNAAEYLLNVYRRIDGEEFTVRKYNQFSVGNVTSHTVDNLNGRTEYFLTVVAKRGTFCSEPSDELSVTTPAIAMEKTKPEISDWDFSANSRVVIKWLPIEDAIDYLVTVNAISLGGEEKATVAFGTPSKMEFPQGWSCKGSPEYYTSANNYGKAAPSYKLGVKSTALTTNVFPSNITGLSFWVKGNSTNSKSHLVVTGRASEDAEWVDVVPELYLADYNSTGKVITTNVPDGIRQLCFTYVKGSGNMAIDDITISFAGEEKAVFGDYDRKSVGNVTSHEITITADSRAVAPHAYEAYIEAVDAAGKYSLPSEAIRLNPGTTGITTPEAMAACIAIDGCNIMYTGTDGCLKLINLSGMTVAESATTGGSANLSAPAAGLYILSTPEGAVKIHITH